MTWTYSIYETATGEFRADVEVSAATWETGLTGQGRASHTIPLFNQGMTASFVREQTTGNKYTIVQKWGSTVVYAGVIQRTRYVRSTRSVVVDSAELRVAYMDSRMTYGVFSYDPSHVALTITDKSHSGAARAVINECVFDDADYWELPIDLPADGSGSFSATWMKSERLTWEDHLAQIEADGCEIFFRPYLSSGSLRWDTIVESKVSFGSTTTVSFDDELEDFEVTVDYAREMTGVLGFGKGGTGADAYGYSPGDGAAQISVRDTWVDFPDLSGARLVNATEALDYLGYPVEQWSFGISVYPSGPATVLPGRVLSFTISGDNYLANDTYVKRVVALRGDAGTMVRAEVQDG